jgi:hypothetical protein
VRLATAHDRSLHSERSAALVARLCSEAVGVTYLLAGVLQVDTFTPWARGGPWLVVLVRSAVDRHGRAGWQKRTAWMVVC